MAIEIRNFAVTIPAGTPVSAKFASPMNFPARVVSEIHVRVPPGPRGEVGFAIGSGGLPIVPYGAGSWIVTDDEDLIFPLTAAITSGAWQLLAYNTGGFDHTLRVYFYCELLGSNAGAGSFTPIPTGTITGSGTGDTGTGGITGTGGLPAPPGATGGDGGTPVITPPGITAPLILPPNLPVIGGAGGGGLAPVPEALLIGVSAAGTVGLLTGGGYYPLSVQQDVDALSAAGLPGIEGDAALDAALGAAAPAGSAAAAAGAGGSGG